MPMDFRICNALKIKPFQALLRNTPFCSLGEVEARGRTTAKPTDSRRSGADSLDRRNGIKCRLLFLIESSIIPPVQTDRQIGILGGN